jgi:uncharacterized protein YpuA (DUF1002 family)
MSRTLSIAQKNLDWTGKKGSLDRRENGHSMVSMNEDREWQIEDIAIFHPSILN